MQKLFNKFLGAESHAAKNPFDLSSRQVFSTKVGLLNVASYIHTMGDSVYSIDMEHVCRSQPLETAAFTKFSSHYEWFFVPYNDLYHSFNQVLAQREDKQSVTSPSLEMPYFSLSEFLKYVLPFMVYDYIMGMASFEDSSGSSDRDFHYVIANPNMFHYSTSARPQSRTISIDFARTFGRYVQKYSVSREFDNESVALGVLRNLDMMGYGNFLPLVKSFALGILSLICLGFDHTDEDVFHVPSRDSLIDLIYNVVQTGEVPDSYITTQSNIRVYFMELYAQFTQSPMNCNLWLPLAYNKVFEQVYRNPYYDFISHFNFSEIWDGPTFDVNFEYVQLFNVDDIRGEIRDYFRLFHIFAPHYHQYHKDMFTGVMPDTQFGDVSVLTDDRSWLNLQMKAPGTDDPNSNAIFIGTGHSTLFAPSVGSSQSISSQPVLARFNPALAISVLNMRKAEALQRFSENMMRAGNRTRDAFRAHFGFTPLSESRNNVLSVGTFDGDIDLNVVASTTDSDEVQLGQLAANGVGIINGKTIKFNSHDFGVLVCINYIHKPAEYDAYGLDKLNQNLDPFDYPYNEFQNVSLAPLESIRLGYQLVGQDYERIIDSQMVSAGSTPVVSRLERAGILGFLPAFIERKTNVDKIHGEFFSSYPYLPESQTQAYVSEMPSLIQGDFSHFVTPRQDNNFSETVSWLYINPNSVDNVFRVKANALQQTDQFFINLNVKVYATQPLSIVGLPY